MPTTSSLTSAVASIAGAEVILHPYKAIYYPEASALLISDAHLGKADHFRKSGIAVPQQVNITNLTRMEVLLQLYQPKRVIFLGDLFHSSMNAAWKDFITFINTYPKIHFELVKGNHDILPQEVYDSSVLSIYDAHLELGPFILTHIPLTEKSELYNLAGHIHPGVVMRGRAKQYLKLPCFYFSEWQGILPAFGDFTGLFKMTAKENDQIFIASNNKVIQVK